MRRSINFGSIFRRKEDLQSTGSKEQTSQGFLLERLAERAITLKEGDVVPITADTAPLDWGIVGGGITVLASAIEGLLGGHARIKAQQLKLLSPSPIDSETQDAIEYEVSLAAVIPQIQDLLGSSESVSSGHPEFETPFTVLAREDSARFAYKKERQEAHDKTVARDDAFSASNGTERPQEMVTEKQVPETVLERPALSLTALRTLSRPPDAQRALPSEPPNGQQNETETLKSKTAIEREQNDQISSNETLPVVALESPNHVSDPIIQPEPVKVEPEMQLAVKAPGSDGDRRKEPSRAQVDGQERLVDEDMARQGLERLQEIFMTSKPLDGRRVASLVQELPGVNGTLILLEGGVVLGGQLPEGLSLEAALQAPEVLKNFTRFINEVEAGQKTESRFVSVTSATTISLVASGQIVLLVSHQGRKLPPGLATRLTQIAEALNLIYGIRDFR